MPFSIRGPSISGAIRPDRGGNRAQEARMNIPNFSKRRGLQLGVLAIVAALAVTACGGGDGQTLADREAELAEAREGLAQRARTRRTRGTRQPAD